MLNSFKRKRKRPLTKIEDALFRGQNRTYAVTEFVTLNDRILLKLAPWIESGGEVTPDSKAVVEARFNNADVRSKETNEQASDDIEYPWDIIGFDSDPISDNRWSFCLHTDCIEYLFESDWPEVEFK
jgi:hypothetical protein